MNRRGLLSSVLSALSFLIPARFLKAKPIEFKYRNGATNWFLQQRNRGLEPVELYRVIMKYYDGRDRHQFSDHETLESALEAARKYREGWVDYYKRYYQDTRIVGWDRQGVSKHWIMSHPQTDSKFEVWIEWCGTVRL